MVEAYDSKRQNRVVIFKIDNEEDLGNMQTVEVQKRFKLPLTRVRYQELTFLFTEFSGVKVYLTDICRKIASKVL